MENGENKDLQGRREFFKEAAKKALPLFAVALLGTTALSSCTKDGWGCDDCVGSCKGDCKTDCRMGCKDTCSLGCKGDCDKTCKGTCDNTCSGGCRNNTRNY